MCVAPAGYFIYLNWIPSYFYKVIVVTLHRCATRVQYWLPFFGAAEIHTNGDPMFMLSNVSSRFQLQVLGLDLRASAFTSLLPWIVMACGERPDACAAIFVFCEAINAHSRPHTSASHGSLKLLATVCRLFSSRLAGGQPRATWHAHCCRPEGAHLVSDAVQRLVIVAAACFGRHGSLIVTVLLVLLQRLQTAAFLGPALALLILSRPGLSPNAAIACMTAALGITSLGEHLTAVRRCWQCWLGHRFDLHGQKVCDGLSCIALQARRALWRTCQTLRQMPPASCSASATPSVSSVGSQTCSCLAVLEGAVSNVPFCLSQGRWQAFWA